MKVSVTRSFCMAHRLPRHTGACHRLHGHRIEVTVSVQCNGYDEDGFVIDFSILKKTVDDVIQPWDHNTLLALEDKKLGNFLIKNIPDQKIFYFSPQPTSEVLACDIQQKVLHKLQKLGYSISGSIWIQVAVSESPGSVAST